jgi:oxalate decarboxylase/phosphoglucose isomerase-like protein (cupin superfamily)
MNHFIKRLVLVVSLIACFKCQESALKRRQQFNAKDFVYNLFGSQPNVVGQGGTGRRADINDLPSLQGLGVSSVFFKIDPCAINLPHVHPRGTELFHVISGQFQTGFLEENSGRMILNNLTQGMVTIFPQGLIHFEQNLGCTPASFLSAVRIQHLD